MSSKSEVTIFFKDDVPVEFDNAEDLQKTLKSFHGEDCAIHVESLQHFGDNELGFELDSTRHVNLIWQQDLLKRYLQEKHANKVAYISSIVWTTSDDEGIYFEDGNGQEFKEI